MSQAIKKTQPGRLAAWDQVPLSAPSSLADVFRLFCLYNETDGLDALLARVVFTGKTPAELTASVLARAPHASELAGLREVYDPAQYFRTLVTSREFQTEMIRLFLLAFPEKRRLFFVHIPKCAGTDLESHLSPRYLSLGQGISSPAWTTTNRLFGLLSGLSTMVNFVPDIFIHGHLPFHNYVRTIGIRPHDEVFTVLRDPIEVVISQVNYNIGLLRVDPQAKRPDTRQVMSQLGIEKQDAAFSPGQLRELALRGLRTPAIARANRIVGQFGGGKAASALGNIISYDVEITELSRYRAWLKQRWGIESKTRRNASVPIIGRDDVTSHLDYLLEQTAEDRQIYETVWKALEKMDSPSLRGSSLA
jgi:hypothetical protein